MKLGAMAQAAGLTAGPAGDLTVTGFAIDHRKVAPGTVFGAYLIGFSEAFSTYFLGAY